jgi:hypothetical protein
MDKRYQVFVSSTYEDLKEERQAVMLTLLKLNCIPAGMELFPSANEDQWTFIKRVIDECDYYILIIAGRYGSRDHEGIGYTQKEYEYAFDAGKPIISFLHKDPEGIAPEKTEPTSEAKQKLAEFRKIVTDRKLCSKWNSADSLSLAVFSSLLNLINTQPSEGWVKSNQIYSENAEEILQLKKKIEQYELKLANLSTLEPDGIDDLSKENDRVYLEYKYEYFDNSYHGGGYRENINRTISNWNSILGRLGPHMLVEATNDDLEYRLNALIRDLVLDKLKRKHRTENVSDITILNKDLMTVLIQLQSLGLIGKSPKEHKDSIRYWSLTPYGERYLSQILAIKRKLK